MSFDHRSHETCTFDDEIVRQYVDEIRQAYLLGDSERFTKLWMTPIGGKYYAVWALVPLFLE